MRFWKKARRAEIMNSSVNNLEDAQQPLSHLAPAHVGGVVHLMEVCLIQSRAF